MRLYWVKLNGEAIHFASEQGEQLCGFYKNEYVFSDDETGARQAAAENVRAALRAKSSIRRDEIDRITITAETVEPTWRLWKVIRPGGFIFYPIE